MSHLGARPSLGISDPCHKTEPTQREKASFFRLVDRTLNPFQQESGAQQGQEEKQMKDSGCHRKPDRYRGQGELCLVIDTYCININVKTDPLTEAVKIIGCWEIM